MQRRTMLVLMLLALSTAAGLVGCPRPEVQLGVIAHGGLLRTFRLFTPSQVNWRTPVPLVIVLHGGEGDGFQIAQYTGFDDVARREGFLVAYPDGYFKHWNDGRDNVNHYAYTQNVDDVGFIRALITRVNTMRNVDTTRVYVTGMSNGGMMTHRIAGELSTIIAAAAPVVANMPQALLPNLAPTAPVPMPMLIINGTADPIVPWNGGLLIIDADKSLGTVASVEETVGFWAQHNGCATESEREWLPDTDPADGARAWMQRYAGSRAGAEVVFYGVDGGGHTWPGGRQYLPQWAIGPTCRDIDATEVIWRFFAQHRRTP